jgi:hypothetical protein
MLMLSNVPQLSPFKPSSTSFMIIFLSHSTPFSLCSRKRLMFVISGNEFKVEIWAEFIAMETISPKNLVPILGWKYIIQLHTIVSLISRDFSSGLKHTRKFVVAFGQKNEA